MKIIIDTSVWSRFFRRTVNWADPIVVELHDLIDESRAQMIGPVRQEVLSGIRFTTQYVRLRKHLRAFPDLPLEMKDYEVGAEYYNLCRKKGIQGSNVDFLICSIAKHRNMPIFTTDGDFHLYKPILAIEIHIPRMPLSDHIDNI